MKNFKPRLIIFLLGLLLLSSCIIKSLHPFYTKDIIYFEKKLIGNWIDTENSKWNILPFEEVILKENKKTNTSELNDDEFRTYEMYKNSYVAYIEKDSTESIFLAMPFKIDNQLFLDFTPIEYIRNTHINGNKKSDLYEMHLIETHSLAKVDILSHSEISFKWLSSKKLEELLNENRIKIEHEKVGFGETVLLTASSEELVKFIKKYMASKDEDKWKTDVEFNLKRVND
jgi:hypothetical protein